jgi:hypothetical protein
MAPRPAPAGGVIDVPGYAAFDEPGCYQLYAGADGVTYGPFGVLAGEGPG